MPRGGLFRELSQAQHIPRLSSSNVPFQGGQQASPVPDLASGLVLLSICVSQRTPRKGQGPRPCWGQAY